MGVSVLVLLHHKEHHLKKTKYTIMGVQGGGGARICWVREGSKGKGVFVCKKECGIITEILKRCVVFLISLKDLLFLGVEGPTFKMFISDQVIDSSSHHFWG